MSRVDTCCAKRRYALTAVVPAAPMRKGDEGRLPPSAQSDRERRPSARGGIMCGRSRGEQRARRVMAPLLALPAAMQRVCSHDSPPALSLRRAAVRQGRPGTTPGNGSAHHLIRSVSSAARGQWSGALEGGVLSTCRIVFGRGSALGASVRAERRPGAAGGVR